jgi:hypothetical protein
MKMFSHCGLNRIVTGWVVFVVGLALLLWLHTFRDHAAHSLIVPLFLLLWVILVVLVWDGRNVVAPRFRFFLFSFHALMASVASVLFFQHLLRTSL